MWCESWLHHWLWVHDSLLDWLCRRRWIMDWLMDLWVNLRYWSRRRMGLGANIRMRVGANGWWICCLPICCFWSTELTMSWNFLSNNFNKQSTLYLEKDVFRLVTNVGQRKNLSHYVESNLRPSDSALQCSTTKPFFSMRKRLSLSSF